MFSGDTKATIIFNEQLQYENPLLWVGIVAHEVLHQDEINPGREELINNSMEDTIHGQTLLETPSLAHAGTELARRQNTSLLARINSWDAAGALRLLEAQGNVYPGAANALPYYGFPFVSTGLGGDAPGSAALAGMVRTVTRVPVADADFDDTTLALLDACQRLLRPRQVLALAKILRLDTSAQATAAVASQ